ncbi:hypothetical protein BDV30DRAFT_143637 [Aspergillus minisclerotigenes]|uniref:Uncharacterized protein n=1 Tax=Aspergillus minisclerotigenes TaxID=656917 RepID=A0A5N6IYL8_9EURO|nr:hypothetical protein BDV30DRAFT_143637 [Aspergillus minisclerotigenes]
MQRLRGDAQPCGSPAFHSSRSSYHETAAGEPWQLGLCQVTVRLEKTMSRVILLVSWRLLGRLASIGNIRSSVVLLCIACVSFRH